MAKVKNKRNSGLADKVHSKKKSDVNKKKLNPFEVHINKEKIKVLGKKSKHDRGLPGVSRAKAIQKRKETLGTEMKLMHKTNAFIDRRIGEKNQQLTAEDRMVARFAAERAKQHGKKNIYNLADDEILTHRGQTLEQIEKFDDPRSSDEEEDIGKKFGGLDDDFVSEGHFGGGMLSKSEKDGAKSHKDLIEQLIAESKKRKAEKQKEKEQTLDLTEKLDSEWKDLQPVVFKRARVENEGLIDKLLSQAEKKGQDYDKMMRELKFEKRGTPSDGLKSNEKQMKEERQRLEQMEKERMQRMVGEEETAARKVQQSAPKHRSADDLDDNFEIDEGHDYMLSYDKDGKPLMPEHVLKDYSVPNSKAKFEDGVSDTSSEEGDEESGDDEPDNEESDEPNSVQNEAQDRKKENTKTKQQSKVVEELNESMDKDKGKKKSKIEEPKEIEESSEDSEEDDENNKKVMNNKSNQDKKEKVGPQNTKNVGNINSEDNDDEERNKKLPNDENNTRDSKKVIQDSKTNNEDEESDSEESDDEENDVDDLKDLKVSDGESDDETVMQDTEKIGSFFDLQSEKGDNLKELLTGKTPSQQSTILQKLIKQYDPSLGEDNRDKLTRLYAHMLQYINDIFSNLQNEGDVLKSFLIFDKLAPYFYDLSHTNKVSTKKLLVDLLKEKHDLFQKYPKKIPQLNTLIFFKLVSLIYPTSDYKHPVTTPSLVFMSEILAQAKFRDAASISKGLFITSLILEYTVLSKRFVPSAVNFLRGILYLSANTSIINPIQVVPPFKLHKEVKILNLVDDCSDMSIVKKMFAKDLVAKDIDNDYKIRCLLITASQIKEYFSNCNELDAQESIFGPHLQLFNRIYLEMYPKKVANLVQKILQDMKESLEMRTYVPLSKERKKPKALRLYEPDIQEVFTGKSSKLPREQADRRRLQKKLKSEMKGALREIRRDKAYIASVKIRQRIQSDNVRKEKVRQIYKDASIQQGELNQLKRMK